MPDYEAIQKVVRQRFACHHERAALTRLETRANAIVFRRQCLRCGECLANLKTKDLSESERKAAIEYNRELHTIWWSRQNDLTRQLVAEASIKEAAAQQEAFAGEREERSRRYNAFLASPRWQELRGLVFRRAKGICEGCLQRPPTEVHHLNYERFGGDEMLFDLAAVCGSCHRKIHKKF